MSKRMDASVLLATVAFTSLALGASPPGVDRYRTVPPSGFQPSQADQQTSRATSSGDSQAPPTEANMRARAQRLLANQHRNDDATEQYEHIEREVSRTGGKTPRTFDDKTYRVVPTGTGTLKILLKENGRPVDPAQYHRQLQSWEDVLELMVNPNDPRTKTAYAKSQKKKRDRAEFVNAMNDAYMPKSVGQETVSGHVCDVIQLDPNPQFRAHSLFQDILTHVTAKIWVDDSSDQLVRGEAHIMRDISIGGGILGKLYRGSVFSMEQAEVVPGIWLPTRYRYDFMGRKFLFTFEQHREIEVTQYRRVGTPQEALQVVKNELAKRKIVSENP